MGTISTYTSHYFLHTEEWAEIMLSLSDIKPREVGFERTAISAARRIVKEQYVLLDFLDRMENIRGFLESVKEIGEANKEVSKTDPTLHI